MSQSEEFRNLLRYIEAQDRASEPVKNIKLKPNEVRADTPMYRHKRTSKAFDINKFEDAMRSKMMKNFERRFNINKRTVSVTELLGCVRKNYYLRLRFPIDYDKYFRFAYLDLINNIGNAVHDYIQTMYNFDAVELSIESKEYKIKGRIDALSKNNIVEIKTIDPSVVINDPQEKHYLQGLIYSYILNKEYDYNIDTVTIVYASRNLKNIVPIDVPINWNKEEKKVLTLMNRAPVLLDAVKNKKLPEVLGSSQEECKYCPYMKICGQNETTISETGSEPSKGKEPVFLL